MDQPNPALDPDASPPVIGSEGLPQEPEPSPFSNQPPLWFDLKLFGLLLAASLVGSIAVLPFTRWSFEQAEPPLIPRGLVPLVLAVAVAVEVFVSAVAIVVGLVLGPRLNLGKLLPAESARHTSAASRFWVAIGEPLVLGAALGAIVGVFAWNLEPAAAGSVLTLATPAAWESLVASIGAGIREEIWLRFGFMTFVVWLGTALIRFLGRTRTEPPAIVVWIANILAALVFALIHVPQTYALVGLTTASVLLVLYGNGMPGLVFGWLYWRRGLIPAMVAHFSLGLVLKVVIPVLF
jgi:membrane protease YdiL (CAAX protease family)